MKGGSGVVGRIGRAVNLASNGRSEDIGVSSVVLRGEGADGKVEEAGGVAGWERGSSGAEAGEEGGTGTRG